MGGDNPDLLLGTYIDPTVAYGPSAARVTSPHKESEDLLLSDAPVDGPLTPDTGPVRGLNPKRFLSSPVGVLLVALPLAYILFDRTFGAAS